MMKKYFSIFSLALMLVCCNFVFTSCGDDDDDDDDDVVVEKHYSSKDLIGTWEYTPDDAPGTISSTTFFEDGTAMNVVRDKVVDPSSTDTDKDGVIYKLIETYEVVGDSIFFVHKHQYSISRYKDSMWHPLDDESRKGAKFEFVDENTLKIYDSENKEKPEIIMHRNTSAKVEKIELFDKRIIGTWEMIVDHGLCRDVMIFDADGKYHQMDQDINKDSSVKYYDDNLTYCQSKGYYNTINGTINMLQTHEWDHKWDEKEWRKERIEGNISYEIVDENTLNISYTSYETGKKKTDTFTRVK